MLGHHLEIRHLTIFVVILIIFQLAVSFVQRNSISRFLAETQELYQQDSADRLANLTATSLELLLESQPASRGRPEEEARIIIQGFNIIFSQQLLHQNVQEVCLLVERDGVVTIIDDGKALYDFVFDPASYHPGPQEAHPVALRLYDDLRSEMRTTEQMRTIVEGGETFHTFVPFVPRGEYVGALYMKNAPDFGLISRDLISSYGQTTAAYFALILFGLIAMYYISSYTLRERNEAQQRLFEEQAQRLGEQISVQNELMFTKRIYHTHHKAEKIMGFIKEDLRHLTQDSIDVVRHRITKYANFVARVIYDMKWYDPPVQTIRGSLFKTDVNEVIRFLVENIFKRVVRTDGGVRFDLDLDETLPPLPLNEYVIWEVLEPLIQNSLDHAGIANSRIAVGTLYDPSARRGTITISDAGRGIDAWLLERDEMGVKKIFREHTTTHESGSPQHSGYGCYLAYEIAKERCGWDLDADNLPDGGSRFTLTFSV